MGSLNVGNIDRVVRIALGIALMALAATRTIGYWGYALGVVALATGMVALCPLYSLLGWRTTSR